jgi:SAM-dependent methyltransferase
VSGTPPVTSEAAGRAEHNARQIAYFEAKVSPRMVPVGSPYLQRHVTEALRFAGLGKDDRVLEVGCGMGRYTLLLADRVRVEGLDLSDVLLERLRQYDGGRRRIPLHCADLADPPPQLVGRFDSVIGFFTLHHVHDLAGCFAGAARLVRSGGSVVFLEPNALNPLFYVQILVTPGMTWEGDGGMVRMRRGPIFAAMRKAGLERLALRRFGFFPPLLANRPWGRRLEAVLERFPPWRVLLPFQIVIGYRA